MIIYFKDLFDIYIRNFNTKQDIYIYMEEEFEPTVSFKICPECGVGNPKGAKNCMVCDKNLENTIVFMEDDSFDLEITKECLVEYRKNFWGTNRTGKVNKYLWDMMENVEFGAPINRFKFLYEGKKVVLPLREENMETMRKIYMEYQQL